VTVADEVRGRDLMISKAPVTRTAAD
jgi:hypothetical protein